MGVPEFRSLEVWRRDWLGVFGVYRDSKTNRERVVETLSTVHLGVVSVTLAAQPLVLSTEAASVIGHYF